MHLDDLYEIPKSYKHPRSQKPLFPSSHAFQFSVGFITFTHSASAFDQNAAISYWLLTSLIGIFSHFDYYFFFSTQRQEKESTNIKYTKMFVMIFMFISFVRRDT